MRYMIIVKATPNTEAGVMPTREEMDAMGRFNEQMIKAGIMLAADGLHSSASGVRITFDKTGPKFTDGPFAETKELTCGYWLIDVKSKEEAVEWASRVPFTNGEEVEVRKVFEASDFPPEFVDAKDAAKERAWR